MAPMPLQVSGEPPDEQLRRQYGDAIEAERTTRLGKVARLREEAAAAACEAKTASAVLRAEAERQADDIRRRAEEKVREVEHERLRRMQEHHIAISSIENSIEEERQRADAEILAFAEEEQEVHRVSDERVRQIMQSREGMVAAARRRTSEAEELAASLCREAAENEAAHAARGREATMRAAQVGSTSSQEVKQQLDALQDEVNQSALEMQRDLAQRLEQLMAEAAEVRRGLDMQREAAEREFEADVQAQREELQQLRVARERALDRVAERSRQAAAFVQETAKVGSALLEEQDRRRVQVLSHAAEEVLSHRGPVAGPDYAVRTAACVADLEELAQKLRAGLCWRSPGRPGYSAEPLREMPTRTKDMTLLDVHPPAKHFSARDDAVIAAVRELEQEQEPPSVPGVGPRPRYQLEQLAQLEDT